MMPYKVKIDAFEGPLDLLLHLINRLEIDIYDIPVSEITEQYMFYIHTMQELELDIASEYLMRKLIEYRVYKEAAEDLRSLEEIRSQVYTKAPSDLSEYGAQVVNPKD